MWRLPKSGAANRTAAFLDRFTQGHNVEAALRLLDRHRIGEPARSGDELPDGWTIVTRDHSLSAQWEHTVLVTQTGYEILTVSSGTPPMPPLA